MKTARNRLSEEWLVTELDARPYGRDGRVKVMGGKWTTLGLTELDHLTKCLLVWFRNTPIVLGNQNASSVYGNNQKGNRMNEHVNEVVPTGPTPTSPIVPQEVPAERRSKKDANR